VDPPDEAQTATQHRQTIPTDNPRTDNGVSRTASMQHFDRISSRVSSHPLDADEPSQARPSEAHVPSNGTTEEISSSSPLDSRGVRWLDREVRAGRVHEDEITGRNAQSPRRTDVMLRSYSHKPRYETSLRCTGARHASARQRRVHIC
jgi:hypothetical protein